MRPFRSRLRRSALPAAVLTVTALAGPALPAQAATPASGVLDLTHTDLTWQSPVFAKGTLGGPDTCPQGSAACDRFDLTVDVPAGYWADNPEGGVPISIQWADGSNDFDLYVYGADGKEVAESAGTADPEATVIPNASGTYHVLVVPYDVHSAAFTGHVYLPQTSDAGNLTSFDGGNGSYAIAAGSLKAKVDFLADDQLRLQAAPDGVFTDPAGSTIVRRQPDPQRDTSSFDAGAYYGIRAKDVVLRVYKQPLRFALYKADDRSVIWQENAPLRWSTSGLRQSLTRGGDEQFFGGGEQNGSYSHRDQVMHVANSFNWNEGGYNNSQPFYVSSAGYGVFRNTFAPGIYDFGPSVRTGQQERRLDAYYFVGDTKSVIGKYTALVGKPFMPPVYGLEPGDSDCYLHNANRGERHTLDALKVADGYVQNQMPLGWMLVNDGYGCGYENLPQTGEGLRKDHAQLGLWTQNGLPNQAEEVKAGAVVRKLDVAWVGNGYDFALNACDQAKAGIENNSEARGFVWLPVSWAGAQRCGVLWSGDQSLSWDYIRWQIPTYAGATMSGIAYDTGDVGSIFRHDPKMYARDLQWKAFIPTIMTMDGWASDLTTKKPHDQQPWLDGEPYTSINRKYLQLKERLLPYMYTLSHEATSTGIGAVRPLALEYPGDQQALNATYEFLAGPDFLVAPVYSDTSTRDGIYLPAGTWTDYWTGRTYQGPTTINGYSAPLDTLPLFVKGGSIVPMWPQGTTSWQTRDKAELDYDLYPQGDTSYTLYEDDGTTRQYAAGASATQRVDLHAPGGGQGATVVTIGASAGSYTGKPAARSYQLTVHEATAPRRVVTEGGPLPQLASAAALAGAASGWYYDAATGVTRIKTPSISTDHAFTVNLIHGGPGH
ncbi:glycoside hydrolase [Kitasatospora sp. MMS16-BH015]|uniref:glycoside hydrolase family 31 protein n=1 Tax=Kitasatospora sp. MMS16-BH015 TaxID=2018025 RepID=UPI000CA24223|nr:TIM-barrel domain-containing protein [Kitasatospora sp. MMS16-BH015]AUG75439.1 glycoside hydrolase [Kitasatospora sp. MMS16-BH015]